MILTEKEQQGALSIIHGMAAQIKCAREGTLGGYDFTQFENMILALSDRVYRRVKSEKERKRKRRKKERCPIRK